MSHPLPTDPVRGPGLTDEADRSARVEQLLLAGLDRYFAGHYEDAINIWTRVAFLERGHDRARAYIERARRALAERQRESDEVLERGIEAYHAGDVERARGLLTQAIDQGDASDRALVFLERLGRIGRTGDTGHDPFPVPGDERADRVARRETGPAASRRRPRPIRWLMAVPLVVGAVVAVVLWLASGDGTAPLVSAPVGDPLPVVRVGDAAMDRAATLRAGGDLRGALAVLDTIDPADPLRGEADRLRAEVQRALLAAAPPARGVAP